MCCCSCGLFSSRSLCLCGNFLCRSLFSGSLSFSRSLSLLAALNFLTFAALLVCFLAATYHEHGNNCDEKNFLHFCKDLMC